MTRFIESFTTRHMLTPWTTKAAQTWLFLAAVPAKKVRNYLEHFMNSKGPDRAKYHYEVWAEPSFGFLTVVDHGDFRSLHESEDPERTLKHREVIWTFPAARYRRTDDNLLVERTLVWVQPFYFDNNSYVTFSSREIYGGEKGMADVLIAEGSTGQDFHMDVDLHGFSTYNPRSQVRDLGGMHIRGGPMVTDPPAQLRSGEQADPPKGSDGPPGSTVGPPLPSMKELLDQDAEVRKFLLTFSSILPPEWSIDKPGEHFEVPEIELNSVKQYRDANDSYLAAYRALVSSQVSHSNLDGFKCLPKERVDVRFMWSASFSEQLTNLFGLERPKEGAGQSGHLGKGMHIDDVGIDWDLPAVRLDVRLAVYFTSDAQFDVIKVLHAYGDSPNYHHMLVDSKIRPEPSPASGPRP
ncbi:hypothetical protein [Qipengyuania soli]|uniref:Uncharacterized protein n=1 Tax=Qipengyuania soli TaxID=2782568 RepID=A0A7S8F4S5_9SPHN|nr:hypothetical protein [Qipengyuania soli]QPC99126.1 hypothetical protein IRL76_00630 [Qipengyuania soli]